MCLIKCISSMCKSGRPKTIPRADGRQSRAATLVYRNCNASFSCNELQEFKHGRPYRRWEICG